MAMTFRRSWDFDNGNKVVTKNALRDDDATRALIDSAGYDDTVVVGRLDGHEADIAAVQSDIAALGVADSALDTRVDALELGGGGGGYDDTVLSGRVTANEADIAALQSADTALDGRLDTAEADINTLQSDMTAAQADIVALESGGGSAATENIIQTLTGNTDFLSHNLVANDGTSTSGWPNRMEFEFKPNTGDAVGQHLVGWFNEYGELRGTPAKDNTVAARWFTKDNDADTDHDGATPVIEVVNSRDVRTELFGVMGDGTTYATDMEVRVPSGPTLEVGHLVLGAADSVPANTPANTLIVRTT